MAKQRAQPASPSADNDEPADLPEAQVVPSDEGEDPLRNVKLGVFALVLIGGWLFVLGSNKFHITAPVVFVCLGYFAIVMTVVNLWRTGAATVNANTVDDWQRPLGARGELEKEKKTLLKAIKEAEFDFAMGKLSKLDSDTLIRDYRARAIEVIKELDRRGGSDLTVKQQIELEVKARLALDAQNKPSNRAKNEAAKRAAKKTANADARRDRTDAKLNAGSVDRRSASAEPTAAGEKLGEVVDQMVTRDQLAVTRDEEEESKPIATGEPS